MPMCNSTLVSALACGIFTFAAIPFGSDEALGDDFRVDNEVFVGRQTEPASRSTTIFYKGLVYDFMTDPSEVIVLDAEAGQFTLLDEARRIRADLSMKDVTSFTAQLQQSAAGHSDPFIRFLANPKFEERFDERTNELTLSSGWMVYRLVLQQVANRELAGQYREFCDSYARLNTMLHRGAKPPAARLLVNQAIGRHGAMPQEVRLTVTAKKTSPPASTALTSRHRVVGQLTRSDLERIAQARQFMSDFKPVGFEQYRTATRR